MVARMKIDYSDTQNPMACKLAALGFSCSLIRQKTGLSNGQVGYRLRLTELQVTKYRAGESPIARKVLAATKIEIARYLQAKLKSLMKGA